MHDPPPATNHPPRIRYLRHCPGCWCCADAAWGCSTSNCHYRLRFRATVQFLNPTVLPPAPIPPSLPLFPRQIKALTSKADGLRFKLERATAELKATQRALAAEVGPDVDVAAIVEEDTRSLAAAGAEGRW